MRPNPASAAESGLAGLGRRFDQQVAAPVDQLVQPHARVGALDGVAAASKPLTAGAILRGEGPPPSKEPDNGV